MNAGEITHWRGIKSFIRYKDGENVCIQKLENPGKGNSYIVNYKELSKYRPVNKGRNPLSCPECGNEPPDYISSIECPQCHFKQGYCETFREYLDFSA